VAVTFRETEASAKGVPGKSLKNLELAASDGGAPVEASRIRDSGDRNRTRKPAAGGEETTRSGHLSAGGRRMPTETH
jgi:hypothetical protein